MPIYSVLKFFGNVPLYNHLVEGQMKLHISVQLHNTAPAL